MLYELSAIEARIEELQWVRAQRQALAQVANVSITLSEILNELTSNEAKENGNHE